MTIALDTSASQMALLDKDESQPRERNDYDQHKQHDNCERQGTDKDVGERDGIGIERALNDVDSKPKRRREDSDLRADDRHDAEPHQVFTCLRSQWHKEWNRDAASSIVPRIRRITTKTAMNAPGLALSPATQLPSSVGMPVTPSIRLYIVAAMIKKQIDAVI